VIHACAPRAKDFKRQRCRHEDQINEIPRDKNAMKPKMRSKVEPEMSICQISITMAVSTRCIISLPAPIGPC